MPKRKRIEKLDSSCADLSLDVPSKDGQFLADDIPERAQDESRKHPSPEQLLIREAAKYLTVKQKRVWELWNFDKLTQDEIATKLKVSQPMIAQHIAAIERRIARWCKANLGAYKLLKSDLGESEGC